MPFVVSIYHQVKPKHRARMIARSVGPAPLASAHRTFWALTLFQELYYNLLCFYARAAGHSRSVCRVIEQKAWLRSWGQKPGETP